MVGTALCAFAHPTIPRLILPDGQIRCAILACAARECAAASSQNTCAEKVHFARRIKPFARPSPSGRKIFIYRNQKSCLSCRHPASIAEGRTRRHEREAGSGGRGGRRQTSGDGRGRPSRVVPISRRWYQACGAMTSQAMVAKKPGAPGRARSSR